ncbi:MAG: hypothetical protein JW795_22130 [Chitinivibrionales bacterium]|nr:hypothetical protein [Chitinivibrionales bacterium]
MVNSAYSFVDRTGTLKSGTNSAVIAQDASGIITFLSPVIGNANGEEHIGYFRIRSDSLLACIDSALKTGYTLLNCGFQFSYNRSRSTVSPQTTIELGLCPPKADSEYIDTTALSWVSHYCILNADSQSVKTMAISKNQLFDTSNILDTIAARSTQCIRKTMTITKAATSQKNDTSLVLDTTFTARISDSILTPLQLIKHGQRILFFTSSSIKQQDTTLQLDTLQTVPDTVITHTIKTKLVTVVNGTDTIVIAVADTTARVVQISADIIHQRGKIFSRPTVVMRVKAAPRDSMVHWYLRIPSSSTVRSTVVDNMVFFNQSDLVFSLSFRRQNQTTVDTVIKYLHPTYTDYSTFERRDQGSLDSLCLASGASQRYAVLSVNLSSFWRIMQDSITGKLRFHNIAKATMPFSIDAIALRPGPDSTSSLSYIFSGTKPTSIEQLQPLFDNGRQKALLTKKTTAINFQIGSFLIPMLWQTSSLPQVGYLIMTIPNSHFYQMKIKKPVGQTPFEFLVTNTMTR